MQDAVIVVGLLLGALMILTVCWVWITKQTLGTGGTVLASLGVVLIGLSIWGNISLRVGPFEAELSQARRAAEEAKAAAEVAQETAGRLAEDLTVSQEQFVALTETLESQVHGVALTDVREPVTRNLEHRGTILESLSERGVLTGIAVEGAGDEDRDLRAPGPLEDEHATMSEAAASDDPDEE